MADLSLCIVYLVTFSIYKKMFSKLLNLARLFIVCSLCSRILSSWCSYKRKRETEKRWGKESTNQKLCQKQKMFYFLSFVFPNLFFLIEWKGRNHWKKFMILRVGSRKNVQTCFIQNNSICVRIIGNSFFNQYSI